MINNGYFQVHTRAAVGKKLGAGLGWLVDMPEWEWAESMTWLMVRERLSSFLEGYIVLYNWLSIITKHMSVQEKPYLIKSGEVHLIQKS